MANTIAQDVYNSFESTFSDKKEIPESLEQQWLKMAIGKYNNEIAIDELLEYDSEVETFDTELDQYIIDTLGQMMRTFYSERYASKVNKIASIVGKDVSVNGTNGLQKYAKDELNYHSDKLNEMIENQKPVAMS